MKLLATLSVASRLCALSLPWWTPGILECQSLSAEVATNSSKPWLTLAEVRKKWDGMSLAAVRQAAEKGDLTAQHYLGFCYASGKSVEADDKEALKWFRLAADQGHPTAMVNVGRAYRFGEGVPRDAQAAIRWFKAADERGDALGTVNLGWMYGYVDESPRNAEKAFGLFQKAAEMGQTDSMYELYLAYKNGRGVAIEPQVASLWLAKAAEAGNAMAQSVLGGRFAEPPADTDPRGQQPKNMPEAVRWYRLSADQDCSRGQYYLGLCYLEADGLEKDEEKGLDLIRRAADQGHNLALYELARLYARGIGEPRNSLDQPMELLRRVTRSSAKSLDGVTKWAYDGILFRYQYGVGTERDLVAAAAAYCHAAADGVWEYSLEGKLEPEAPRPKSERGGSFTGSAERSWIQVRQPDIGGMSDEARQVLSAYLKAAKSNPASLAEIGGRYLAGRGVPKNQTNAWLWLTLAQQHGATEVRPTIASIEGQMAPNEMETMRQALPKLVQALSDVSRTVGESSPSRRP